MLEQRGVNLHLFKLFFFMTVTLSCTVFINFIFTILETFIKCDKCLNKL